MSLVKKALLILLGCSWVIPVRANEARLLPDPDTVKVVRPNYRMLHGMFAAQSVLYAGSLYGLSKTWYQNPLTRFTVADDTHEWLQIDKVGHMYTSYQISRHTAALYRKTGISRKQAIIYGAVSGFFFQTPIEILDGFSPDYGFSPGDMVANLAGSALFVGQSFLWNEQRIQPKFSARFTSYASVRPELLGSTKPERLLKDYNGQTYWFSFSPGTFAPESRWPAWLCFSVGYGIENMVSAENSKSLELGYTPYRQYYLSLDIDFTKIKTRSKFVKSIAFMVNTLKIPAPAFEVSKNGINFRPLYF